MGTSKTILKEGEKEAERVRKIGRERDRETERV